MNSHMWSHEKATRKLEEAWLNHVCACEGAKLRPVELWLWALTSTGHHGFGPSSGADSLRHLREDTTMAPMAVVAGSEASVPKKHYQDIAQSGLVVCA